jgi:hypothetical protein
LIERSNALVSPCTAVRRSMERARKDAVRKKRSKSRGQARLVPCLLSLRLTAAAVSPASTAAAAAQNGQRGAGCWLCPIGEALVARNGADIVTPPRQDRQRDDLVARGRNGREAAMDGLATPTAAVVAAAQSRTFEGSQADVPGIAAAGTGAAPSRRTCRLSAAARGLAVLVDRNTEPRAGWPVAPDPFLINASPKRSLRSFCEPWRCADRNDSIASAH